MRRSYHSFKLSHFPAQKDFSRNLRYFDDLLDVAMTESRVGPGKIT
jgi:hypothetical protein